MHELSITHSILDITLRHAAGARVTDIYLVIGQLSSFLDDSIQHYWGIIAAGTPAEGARLHFRRVPAALRCAACGHVAPLRPEPFACPLCGGTTCDVAAGEEFYVEAIDVDDPC